MDRKITAAKRDRNGEITALCNSAEKWSRRTEDVLSDIQAGRKSYYVHVGRRRSYVRVVSGKLQTTPDPSDQNHLTHLPTY